MVRRLLGAPLTEAELRKREAEKHMYKAELGALAVREAISSGDDQLRLYGEAMIAKAADAIATHPDQALAQTMARGMAGPLSIRLTAGNPYVHPAIVDRATAIPRDSSEQPAND
ncbi:MAG TPA: hypothetical protein VFH39_02080 [Candidatus Saccharimonadales bacterium]|nr:hypothetical protein [Candidatus Saccharimonadales bacterium]